MISHGGVLTDNQDQIRLFASHACQATEYCGSASVLFRCLLAHIHASNVAWAQFTNISIFIFAYLFIIATRMWLMLCSLWL